MLMVFKICYFSIEKQSRCIKFAKTLAAAQTFVSEMKKTNQGKDFKIIPIKLK